MCRTLMRPTDAAELDVQRIAAAFERRVGAACPDERDLAIRTLHRLTPAKWTLEWYLPWWLGHAFGLDPVVAAELVLSNVLGLVSIRLQDDLLDGDVAADDVRGATRLGAALFDEAVAVYRRRFDEASPFWPFLERSMAEWRRASAGDCPQRWADLPRRGAPLKVAGFATCLLTDRPERWALVERCLDHDLVALVRYDQVCDWEDDLRADRWNAFVAAVSPFPQSPATRDRNRSTVLAALLTSGVVAAECGRTRAEALRAAHLAAELECPPLAAYLSGYAERTAAQGAEVEAHYRGAAERATTLIFGTSASRT
jgi:hypothetical protein